MDGGKALARVIDLYQYSINEIGPTHINNLDFASIQSLPYFTARRDLDTFEMYMDQFPGDYGLIAFNDMLHEFFGVTTDIDGLQKFIVLSNILQ